METRITEIKRKLVSGELPSGYWRDYEKLTRRAGVYNREEIWVGWTVSFLNEILAQIEVTNRQKSQTLLEYWAKYKGDAVKIGIDSDVAYWHRLHIHGNIAGYRILETRFVYDKVEYRYRILSDRGGPPEFIKRPNDFMSGAEYLNFFDQYLGEREYRDE